MGTNRVVVMAVSLVSALLIGAASIAQSAEDPLSHYVSVDLAIKKSDVMAKALLLDQAQRDAFWPVYAAHQREQARFSTEVECFISE
jgi:hypothetical protein